MSSSSDLPPPNLTAFRSVPRTGVIYVMNEAAKRGYKPSDPNWINLGQGQPETGTLPGAPDRILNVHIDEADQEYAPVNGLFELRQAVADFYNTRFRKGRGSKYSAENVAIGGGGRLSVMRACAAVGSVNLGHFLPDYTAYEELLDVFRRFTPIPILLNPEEDYNFTQKDLQREIEGRGLSALLLSNPSNPTGKLIAGQQLEEWVATARELDCSLMFDEFYSHYIWNNGSMFSAAEYVDDVDRDPVLIFDGLTKNWRYPGWRICWTLGPKSVIEALASAGSFLDGGASRPLQRAAIELLDAQKTEQETAAIQATFGAKRQLMLDGLAACGVRVQPKPEGTFYAWGDLSDLPPSLQGSDDFFRAALEHRVITVPGSFFDVDPGKRRRQRRSRFGNFVRFSFGPRAEDLTIGLERLAQMVASFR